GGAVGNRIAWVGQRHLGDDCHVNFPWQGLSDSQVEILRCQQRLGSVRSMQCVSALGAAPVVSVETLECLKATGRGGNFMSPGGNTFSGGPDTRLRIDSAFTLHGRSLGDNNAIGDFENLYALRNEEDLAPASPFFHEQTAGVQRLRNFVIAEPRGLQVFRLASRCQQLTNGVVLGGSVGGNVTGNNVLLAATPPCPHAPDLVDNVGLIDFDVQDASDPSDVILGRVSNGSSGLLRNLLLYWTTPPADRRPDRGLTDAGGTVSTGATVSQVAIVGWNGSVGHAFDFTPTSAATVSVGAGAHCFADNASDYPAAIASLLPPGTLVGPRPSFPPHSFVAPPGSAWDQAGCGLRGSPGVCAWQRWHQWEDLPLGQTCFGALLEQCGNGAQEPGEECDDGNAADGDGCSGACAIEPGFDCRTISIPPPEQLVIPILYRDFLYA
ncbi:MAG: myxococcus cysteine-rich repeat containing protein, partial [Candidatus Rokuibacteriota bacterium]